MCAEVEMSGCLFLSASSASHTDTSAESHIYIHSSESIHLYGIGAASTAAMMLSCFLDKEFGFKSHLNVKSCRLCKLLLSFYLLEYPDFTLLHGTADFGFFPALGMS